MKQLTRKEAVKIYESELWKTWSDEYLAYFQVRQERLFMPFDEFHRVVEQELGRPVFTHEFADPHTLVSEMEGIIPAPTFEQIIEPIKDKLIIIVS